MKTIAIATAIAAAVSAVAIPAAAQDIVQAEVRYGDLDVASPAGVQVLSARIENTADTVCVRPDNRNLKGMAAFQQCKQAVVQGAVEQLASKGIKLAS